MIPTRGPLTDSHTLISCCYRLNIGSPSESLHLSFNPPHPNLQSLTPYQLNNCVSLLQQINLSLSVKSKGNLKKFSRPKVCLPLPYVDLNRQKYLKFERNNGQDKNFERNPFVFRTNYKTRLTRTMSKTIQKPGVTKTFAICGVYEL